MSTSQRLSRFAAVLALALVTLMGALVLMQARPGSASDEAKPCCFTNERYNGVCKVYPSGDETCGDILAYLNNPMASGKSYCGNTNIRGGWRLVHCK